MVSLTYGMQQALGKISKTILTFKFMFLLFVTSGRCVAFDLVDGLSARGAV